MVESQHIIRQQVLELSLESNKGARNIQEEVSDVFKSRIMPRMERVLDSLSQEGQVLKIDTLELNLGDIEFRYLKDELPLKVEQVLEQEITKVLYQQREGITGDIPSVSKGWNDTKFETFRFLLRSGIHPWNSKFMNRSIGQVFQELSLAYASQVKQIIMQESTHEYVRKRVVYQFSEKQFQTLIALLSATQGPSVISLWNGLQLLGKKLPALSGSARAWNFQLKETLLQVITFKEKAPQTTLALVQQAVANLLISWFGYQRRYVAEKERTPLTELTEHMIDALSQTEIRSAFGPTYRLVQQIVEQEFKKSSVKESSVSSGFLSKTKNSQIYAYKSDNQDDKQGNLSRNTGGNFRQNDQLNDEPIAELTDNDQSSECEGTVVLEVERIQKNAQDRVTKTGTPKRPPGEISEGHLGSPLDRTEEVKVDTRKEQLPTIQEATVRDVSMEGAEADPFGIYENKKKLTPGVEGFVKSDELNGGDEKTPYKEPLNESIKYRSSMTGKESNTFQHTISSTSENTGNISNEMLSTNDQMAPSISDKSKIHNIDHKRTEESFEYQAGDWSKPTAENIQLTKPGTTSPSSNQSADNGENGEVENDESANGNDPSEIVDHQDLGTEVMPDADGLMVTTSNSIEGIESQHTKPDLRESDHIDISPSGEHQSSTHSDLSEEIAGQNFPESPDTKRGTSESLRESNDFSNSSADPATSTEPVIGHLPSSESDEKKHESSDQQSHKAANDHGKGTTSEAEIRSEKNSQTKIESHLSSNANVSGERPSNPGVKASIQPNKLQSNRDSMIVPLPEDRFAAPIWRRPPAIIEEAQIKNAGLALLWPYLPILFKGMDWVKDGAFVSEEYQYRALHFLQYMVTGKAATEEQELTFNKLLVGLQPEAPVPFDVFLTDEELEEAEHLLKTVLDSWKALKSNSVELFRQTFLQKEGLMKKDMASWKLYVERSAYDILLDRLPWSYSVVKLPWMDNLVNVEW